MMHSVQYATSLLDTLLFLHYLALLLLELRHRGQPQYLIRSVSEMSLYYLILIIRIWYTKCPLVMIFTLASQFHV